MAKVKENPFDQSTQEDLWNTWQHGFNSLTKEEQPYEKEMLEYDTYFPVWMDGFNAGKSNRPKTKKAPEAPEKAAQEASSDLGSLSDDDLFNELRRRKQAEYDKLMRAKAEIELKLEKMRYLFQ